MTPEERRRAGRAVEDRMTELGLNAAQVQAQAPVDNKTLASLIRGERDTSTAVRGRIEKVLGWPAGEIARRGRGEGAEDGRPPLEQYSDVEILTELMRRAAAREQQRGLARPDVIVTGSEGERVVLQVKASPGSGKTEAFVNQLLRYVADFPPSDTFVVQSWRERRDDDPAVEYETAAYRPGEPPGPHEDD